MSRPKEEDIVVGGGRQSLGKQQSQFVASKSRWLIVNNHIMIQILTSYFNPHHSLIGIGGIVGNVILHDEEDVVVVISMSLEHLIEGKGIGLMAVVGPPHRASYYHGIPVVEVGIIEVLLLLTYVIIYQICSVRPVPYLSIGYGSLVVFFGRHILYNIELAITENPFGVCGVENRGMVFGVEKPVARHPRDTRELALLQHLHGVFHIVGQPRGCDGFLAIHHLDDGVGKRETGSCLTCRERIGKHEEGIVELCLAGYGVFAESLAVGCGKTANRGGSDGDTHEIPIAGEGGSHLVAESAVGDHHSLDGEELVVI